MSLLLHIFLLFDFQTVLHNQKLLFVRNNSQLWINGKVVNIKKSDVIKREFVKPLDEYLKYIPDYDIKETQIERHPGQSIRQSRHQGIKEQRRTAVEPQQQLLIQFYQCLQVHLISFLSVLLLSSLPYRQPDVSLSNPS